MNTAAHSSDGRIFLGIDTGGTYTDAVLYRDGEPGHIVAKAKALTTRHDLAIGISGAVDAVLEASGAAAEAIALVSLSTTLATNALVEGQGARAGLVMIGFDEKDLARDRLNDALSCDPVVFCPGGHDVHGNAKPLDLGALQEALQSWGNEVTGIAVAALFAVRNPAHEIAARELIAQHHGSLSVTCSHELTSKLGGPRRALTTLLNARLVPLIGRLIDATDRFLASRDIHAPLMVVRGDGALVSAAFARARPIETILSGPAASLVGARHLTGLDDAVVSDIGGTTTDVAVLDRGQPRLDPEGAKVGAWRTMVEAVAMRTFGLGGDSEVSFEDGRLDPQAELGPRRLIPLALVASLHGDAVLSELERQVGRASPDRLDGRFAVRTGMPERFAAGLSAAEAKLFAAIGDVPQPFSKVVSMGMQKAVLDRLVSRGLVHICGFTPSDAAHVLGHQSGWNAQAAEMGAALMARRKDGRGRSIAPTAAALSERVLAALTRRSAEVILETALAEDGHDGATFIAHPLAQIALNGEGGIARPALTLDRSVIGLGASASLHYTLLPTLLGADCVVPADADVANALGAVVGQVQIRAEALVTAPSEGLFRVSCGDRMADFNDEATAFAFADVAAREHAAARAGEAGAAEFDITAERKIEASEADGQRIFIQGVVTAVAAGRPALAAPISA